MQKYINPLAMALLGILLLSTSCQRRDKRSVIISQVQEVSKLATTEFVLGKLIIGTKQKKFFGFNLSESDFVAETEARVKTGIDLSKLQPNDIEINGSSIHIHLPAVEILNFSYPFEAFEIDPELTDLRRKKLTLSDVEVFAQMGEIEIRRDLDYLNIEASTQRNTTLVLTGFLKSLGFGFEDVIITYRSAVKDNGDILQDRLNELREKIGDS